MLRTAKVTKIGGRYWRLKGQIISRSRLSEYQAWVVRDPFGLAQLRLRLFTPAEQLP